MHSLEFGPDDETDPIVDAKGLSQRDSIDAGWSSLVARRAHNPKVVGSNPAPATNQYVVSRNGDSATRKSPFLGAFLYVR